MRVSVANAHIGEYAVCEYRGVGGWVGGVLAVWGQGSGCWVMQVRVGLGEWYRGWVVVGSGVGAGK